VKINIGTIATTTDYNRISNYLKKDWEVPCAEDIIVDKVLLGDKVDLGLTYVNLTKEAKVYQ